jgi:hypothetical protein
MAAYGGRAYWADATRDQQRSRLLDDFARDFQYGANGLRRNTGFAISAVLTIALAIAATTTVFSFINTVYLRPLDVPEGKRFVRIYGADRPEFDLQLGWAAYQTLRNRTRAFDQVAAHYSTAPLYVTSRNQSAEVMGAVVSASYFPMLGVRPELGRFFSADEDSVPDRDAVAVIGHGLWQARFGGDPGVIGEHIVINGRAFTIIGVAPPSFEGVVPSWLNEVWIPTMMLRTGYRWCDGFERTCPITSIIARRAPGVSLGDARSELSVLRASILEGTDPSDSIRTIAADPATGMPAWQQRDYGHLSTLLAADTEGYVRRLVVPLDWRVAGFAVITTVVAVFLFGVFPALRVSRADPAEMLKSGAGGSLARSRVRSALVAGQMMLALSLLVAAGLLTRSFARVMATGSLDSPHLSQLRLRPRLMGYTPERAQTYLVRALEAIRRVPGVVDAVPVRGSMVRQTTDRAAVTLPGEAPSASRNRPAVDYFDVGPKFFATLHVPVLVGREFSERDTPSSPPVAMANEALALRLWSTLNVVGRRIILDGKSFEIVGVVRNYRVHRSDEAPPASAYVAFWQSSFEPQVDARVAIRVNGDPAQLFAPIRRALEAVDVVVPVTETLTMDAQRRASYTEVRLGGAVLVVSASLALFLSAVGLYGVVSFVVARRAKEVGIRLAVGAHPSEVVPLFVRQGLRPMWLGATLGVAASVAFAPLLSRWLFGIAPLDLPTIAGALAAVIAVALMATWVPARRAARTDPVVVFRSD